MELPSDFGTLLCLDCGATFELCEGDHLKQAERAAAGAGYATPKRCLRCCHERRQPVTLTCGACGADFETNEAQRRFATSRGRQPLCHACQ